MLSKKTKAFSLTEAPGIPCPQCGATLRLALDRLLAAAPLFCSACGLELTLDAKASAQAMDAARAVQRTLRDLDNG